MQNQLQDRFRTSVFFESCIKSLYMTNFLEQLLLQEKQTRTEKLFLQTDVWLQNPRFHYTPLSCSEGHLKIRISLCKRMMTKKGFLSKGWEPNGSSIEDKLQYCAALMAVLSNY